MYKRVAQVHRLQHNTFRERHSIGRASLGPYLSGEDCLRYDIVVLRWLGKLRDMLVWECRCWLALVVYMPAHRSKHGRGYVWASRCCNVPRGPPKDLSDGMAYRASSSPSSISLPTTATHSGDALAGGGKGRGVAYSGSCYAGSLPVSTLSWGQGHCGGGTAVAARLAIHCSWSIQTRPKNLNAARRGMR